MSTWFITGCSTGLGRALAGAVLAAGHNAIITARNADSLSDLAEAHPDTALPVALDVTDPAQIPAAVQQGLDRFGGIDVLVNNAGYGYRAAVEEADPADVEKLFATNVHGPVGLIQQVLPGMRERRSGTIVNISSISANGRPAGSGFYAASKAALEGISGALQKEVGPLGIHVITVEPGGFRTDFAGRSLTQSSTEIGDYADTSGKRRKENDTTDGTQPGDPDKAAQALITAVEAEEPPTFLLLGSDAHQAITGVLEAQLKTIEDWKSLTTSTDFES
jgi:NAD(P)-dependent dehydrogenase (short-subunit alcohol dehydrogenase family)